MIRVTAGFLYLLTRQVADVMSTVTRSSSVVYVNIRPNNYETTVNVVASLFKKEVYIERHLYIMLDVLCNLYTNAMLCF